MSELLNKFSGRANWGPANFLGRVGPGDVRGFTGMARGVFAITATAEDDKRPVSLVHLPSGAELAECKHGAQAMRLADELMATFPEFGLPFDEARLIPRTAEIVDVMRKHGVLK